MATIVKYTDRKTPRNGYPRHIISPSHAGPCCVWIAEQEGRWMV